jgi:hypothetical protein
LLSKPDHAQWRSRTDPVPDWSKSPDVMEKYESRMIEGSWRVLGALLSHAEVAKVHKAGTFGKNARHWAGFMETFIRNNAGYPTIFPEEFLHDKGYADKRTIRTTSSPTTTSHRST